MMHVLAKHAEHTVTIQCQIVTVQITVRALEGTNLKSFTVAVGGVIFLSGQATSSLNMTSISATKSSAALDGGMLAFSGRAVSLALDGFTTAESSAKQSGGVLAFSGQAQVHTHQRLMLLVCFVACMPFFK